MKFDVVALGELLIDFASEGTDSFGYPVMAAHPGGAPANFLAALAKYGMQTAFIGKVGDDSFGHMLVKTLEDLGIDCSALLIDPEYFTTLAFVTFDENRDRSFSFARKPGADTMLRPEELRLDLINDARVFHFGTLSLTDEPARSATQAAVKFAKDAGKWISFDPNLREPLWADMAEARNQILWGLSQADIIKISDYEVQWLWGLSPEEGAAKLFEEFSPQMVFVTCGAEGCIYANKEGYGRAVCPKVTPKDTTGAGDIFGGSMMYSLLSLGKDLSEITGEELAEAAAFACAAASLSTEKEGGLGSVPDLDTVLTNLAENT